MSGPGGTSAATGRVTVGGSAVAAATRVLALAVVLGSYVVAGEVQVRGPQRRARRVAAANP